MNFENIINSSQFNSSQFIKNTSKSKLIIYKIIMSLGLSARTFGSVFSDFADFWFGLCGLSARTFGSDFADFRTVGVLRNSSEFGRSIWFTPRKRLPE